MLFNSLEFALLLLLVLPAYVLILPDQSTFSGADFAGTYHLTPAAAQRYTAWIGDELELGQWRAQ